MGYSNPVQVFYIIRECVVCTGSTSIDFTNRWDVIDLCIYLNILCKRKNADWNSVLFLKQWNKENHPKKFLLHKYSSCVFFSDDLRAIRANQCCRRMCHGWESRKESNINDWRCSEQIRFRSDECSVTKGIETSRPPRTGSHRTTVSTSRG